MVQRAYAECAEGYGFKIDPCPPADPAKKGVVESGVKYVKGNFLRTRTFRDLTDLNEQVRRWVLEEAGVRIHGTTSDWSARTADTRSLVLTSRECVAATRQTMGVERRTSFSPRLRHALRLVH